MKKIIFVLPSLAGGGAERVVINLLKVLDRKKFSATLFLFWRKGVYWEEVPSDVPIYCAFEEKENMLLNFWRVIGKLNKLARDADIIVGCSELMPTYVSLATGYLCGCKTIGWVHIHIKTFLDQFSPIKRWIHFRLISFLYPKLDGMITVSEGVRNSVLTLLPPFLAEKTQTIYNPNSLDEILFKANQEEIKFSCHCPTLLGVGRLEPQKNFALLIRVHAKLYRNGIENHLFILGDGSERNYLEQLIRELKVEHTVTLLGFRKNPYVYMKNADVFVMSSDYEGLPTVLIEAMALGLPIVSTNCPSGPAEVLDYGKCGMLVEMNNEEAMSEAIQRVLKNRNLYQALKKAGMERAHLFDKNFVIKSFEEFFEDVIKQ